MKYLIEIIVIEFAPQFSDAHHLVRGFGEQSNCAYIVSLYGLISSDMHPLGRLITEEPVTGRPLMAKL